MIKNLAIPAMIVFRRLLRPFNLDVVRIGTKPTWLAGSEVTDPLTYLYFSEMRRTPLVRLRIADARLGFVGFPFDMSSRNPFVLAFDRAAESADRATSYEAVRSVLSDFYDSVRPSSALELLSLRPEDAPGLDKIEAQNCLLPWGAESVEDRAWRLKMWAFAGSLANGRRVVMPRHGMTNFGPVSGKKLEHEVERVLRLHKSIEANGFIYTSKHPMEVTGLRRGAEYRWLAMRGRHRFAACASMGISTVEARVTRIVRREDASAWPQVVSGAFSERGALRLFDRLFEGVAPACAHSWTRDAGLKRRPATMSALPTRPARSNSCGGQAAVNAQGKRN